MSFVCTRITKNVYISDAHFGYETTWLVRGEKVAFDADTERSEPRCITARMLLQQLPESAAYKDYRDRDRTDESVRSRRQRPTSKSSAPQLGLTD